METVLPVPVRNVGNRTKTNGTARRVAHHPAHGIDNVAKGLSLCRIRTYCSLFAIAWSISLSSAARCSAELMAPTIGSPTMLPF